MPIKINSINAIRKRLHLLPTGELEDICLKMAKYKKENKELLNYLLFEADDEEGYINDIQEEIRDAFNEINKQTFYYTKKNVRRIHRMTIKYIRYSGKPTTEIDLLIYFCRQMQICGVSFKDSKVILNLYQRQVINIEKALNKLHEDIRLDYEVDFDEVKKGLTL